jgi:hypothetical protein
MRLRTLFLVAVSLAAVIGGLWYWRKTEETATRRLETWHEQERIDATVAALDRRYEWPAGEVSLAELAALIDKQSGLAVDLDRLAIESEGESLNRYRFDIPGSTLSIASLLRLTVESQDLAYDVHDGRIAITTEDASRDRNRLRTVVYPLPQPEPSAARVPEEQWQNLITTLIEPDNWDEVGGQGHCETVPGGMVIVQHESAHRQIKPLVESIGRMQSIPGTLAPIRLEPATDADADRRLLANLRKPANVASGTAPLRDVLRDVATHLPLVVDWHALTEASVQTDAPLSITGPFDNWEGLFQYIEEQYGIHCFVSEGILIVTSAEVYSHSQLAMPTIAYPVGDLASAPQQNYTDSLIALITSTIEPDTWVDRGGAGSIHPGIPGWLIVKHSAQVHQKIEPLLSQLRQLLAGDVEPSMLGGVPVPSAEEQRIHTALDRAISVRFTDTPLKEAIESIGRELDIPTHLAERRFAKDSDRVYSMHSERPVRERLSEMLRPLGLTYCVRNDALEIMTQAAAAATERLQIRIYDTRSLMDADLGVVDGDQLRELLSATLNSTAWNRMGRPGTTRHFRGLLIVVHTQEQHDRSARFLSLIEDQCAGVRRQELPRVVELEPDLESIHTQRLLARTVHFKTTARTPYMGLMQLAEQAGVSIVIENNCLTETLVPTLSISPSDEVEVALAVMLERILFPCNLSYLVKNGQVIVTHPTDADSWARTEVRLYRIDDLSPDSPRPPAAVIEQIVAQTDVAHWELGNGLGVIRPVGQRWLCIAASSRLHERVADVLAQMRTGELPRREVERRKLIELLKAANEMRIENEAEAFLNRPEVP